jgi:hypothetical protein
MPDRIAVEHSKRTDAAYSGPDMVYVLDPDKVKLRKMEPARFTAETFRPRYFVCKPMVKADTA